MKPIFSRIETLSKKDRVVATLREAIVCGRMKPGDAVVEGKVARQLGVGQPVIREALLDLEHQASCNECRTGAPSVTKLGADEIEQIQQVRVELEGLAIELARARATPADVKALRAIVARMGKSAEAADLAKFNDCDLALHRALWQLSGNKYLADALERAVVPMLTFFYLSSGQIGDLHRESVASHAALVEAVAAPTKAESVRLALEALRDQSWVLATPPLVARTRADPAHRRRGSMKPHPLVLPAASSV
jgi:DNA-binding GntR family transcriptional regulator